VAALQHSYRRLNQQTAASSSPAAAPASGPLSWRWRSRCGRIHQGGIGWLKPTVPALFRKTWRDSLINLTKMTSTERLIVRSEDERRILASLWLETQLGMFSTRLTLMYLPGMMHLANALLTSAVRRLRGTALSIEHPFDDEEASALLRQLHFSLERSVWHMRLDLLHTRAPHS
jgi:hypothetical protein